MAALHYCKCIPMRTYVLCALPCLRGFNHASDNGRRHALRECTPGPLAEVCVLTLQKEEDFFACKWTVNEATGDNLLLAAGLNAALRVINVSNETLQWVGNPPAQLRPPLPRGANAVFVVHSTLNCYAAYGRRRRAMATPSTTLRCTRCDPASSSQPAGWVLHGRRMQPGLSDGVHESMLSSGARCHGAWCCLQDQALRVWNIQTKVCVAMLHGDGGHRNEILSVVKPQAQPYCMLMHTIWINMMCQHCARNHHCLQFQQMLTGVFYTHRTFTRLMSTGLCRLEWTMPSRSGPSQVSSWW